MIRIRYLPPPVPRKIYTLGAALDAEEFATLEEAIANRGRSRLAIYEWDASIPSALCDPVKIEFDRAAYQREYMREYRRRQKAKAGASE